MSAYAEALKEMTAQLRTSREISAGLGRSTRFEGLIAGRESAVRTLLDLAPADVPARVIAEARAALGAALAEVPVTKGDALPKESVAVPPASVPESACDAVSVGSAAWGPSSRVLVDLVELLQQLRGVEVCPGVEDEDRPTLAKPLLEHSGQIRVGLDAQRTVPGEADADPVGADRLPGHLQFSGVVEVNGHDARPSTFVGDLLEDDEVGHRRGGCDLRVSLDLYVSDDERRSHDASPSAGEGAEPGLASTLSVGGERAAGARNEEAPAATPAGDCSRSINPAALRSIRELAGLRSGDLARAAGISYGFLSNIEAGRETPSPSVLQALAKRLGVPIDAITQTS